MAEAVVETRDLAKSYGERRAVDGVTMTVEPGEIYGFLGPNGAGKTSVIRMLLGLVPPTDGRYAIFGEAFGTRSPALRRRVGALQEKPRAYPDMTGRDYLRFFGELYGVAETKRRAAELLDHVGLAEAADLPIGTYSRGMQQKVCIARALLHDPELLVLDEPASGLDPRGLLEIRELLASLKARGKTILLSSHHLSETERLCDRVGIMDRGRLVAEGAVDEVSRALGGRAYVIELDRPRPKVVAWLRGLSFVTRCKGEGAEIEVEVTEDRPDTRVALAVEANTAGGVVLSVQKRRASLEDVFFQLTKGRETTQ